MIHHHLSFQRICSTEVYYTSFSFLNWLMYGFDVQRMVVELSTPIFAADEHRVSR